MQQILLNVKDQSKVNFLLELLRGYDFVEILTAAPAPSKNSKAKRTKAQLKFSEGLREAFQEVELHLQGKKTMTKAEDLIQELQNL